jgi:hypothetical protein
MIPKAWLHRAGAWFRRANPTSRVSAVTEGTSSSLSKFNSRTESIRILGIAIDEHIGAQVEAYERYEWMGWPEPTWAYDALMYM